MLDLQQEVTCVPVSTACEIQLPFPAGSLIVPEVGQQLLNTNSLS